MPGRCRRCSTPAPTLIGKTITDEVSLGILGENPFEGTPINPRAPGRVPGGSSAGSAAAVAAGHLRHRARHRHRRLGAGAGELLRPLRHPPDAWPARPDRHDGAGAEFGHDRLVRRATPRHSPVSRRSCSASRSRMHCRARLVIASRRLRVRRSRDGRRARTDGRQAARG